ncbi:MAG: AAA family ATPase [bacterium]|nr:AAA family ATPase [bacterium]
MYENFFGFNERPFQLVPNPEYLYLSRSHEEAIAHLKYALSHGDGFVELSGEVGTGKTTLCRAFLEELEENSEIAYIFNPRLSSMELLQTINDEFDIPSDAPNAKGLIDTLNTFLMEKKASDKNAILLIDEAQNLDKDVLEQLRLLSNLETNKSKLLQIILVGQPELGKMLDSYELRQLRQRITLSWYLTPLSRKETKEYIRHRVDIAAKKAGDRFSEAAYRIVYNYSGGIPRLINIACDRMLLTAFGFNKQKVSGAIAADSIKELKNRGRHARNRWLEITTWSAAAVCVLLTAAFLLNVFPFHSPSTGPQHPVADTSPVGKTADATKKTGPADRKTKKLSQPATKTPGKFQRFLADLTGKNSRQSALQILFASWKVTPTLPPYLDNVEDGLSFFKFAASRNGFGLMNVDKELALIEKLNLPAAVEFLLPNAKEPLYLTVTNISEGYITLRAKGKNEIRVEAAEIEELWTGSAFILWKDFFDYPGDIPIDAPVESILTLKMLLRDIGFKQLKMDSQYDTATRDAVKTLQLKHGIRVDGIVGSQTKIAIYNEKSGLDIPHIQAVPPYMRPMSDGRDGGLYGEEIPQGETVPANKVSNTGNITKDPGKKNNGETNHG